MLSCTQSPRRRWSFSLRALLVVLGRAPWLVYELNWIRERHNVLADPVHMLLEMSRWADANGDVVPAPGLLWLFGERGWPIIEYHDLLPEQVEHIRQLFPEAEVKEGGDLG